MGRILPIVGSSGSFEHLDEWLRHRLRSILWRQWKRGRTRFKELTRRGIAAERARHSAGNGRGPWWNAGASHMNQAVPTRAFRAMGLLSFSDLHSRILDLNLYEPPYTEPYVRWCGRRALKPAYPIRGRESPH